MNKELGKKRFFSVLLALVTVLILGVGTFAAEDLTGNEVLAKMDNQQEVITQGEILSVVTFKNENADGTTSTNKFGALARRKENKPNVTLLYYLQPEYISGSILLSKDNTDGGTDMWLYLPALGQVKKLSTSAKQKSFAGSTLSREDIGSRTMGDEYNAEIVEETTVEVGEKSIPAYKLSLTAKEGIDPDYPKRTVWVGQNNWLLLRSEEYDSAGQLMKEMMVKELTTFEGNTVTKELVTTDIDAGASTTVIYGSRERPEQDVPDSVFDPENLKDFDPAKWGLGE